MKNSTYLIVLLALGLVFVTYKWIGGSNPDQPAEKQATNAVYDNIMTRTSVRTYSSAPVSDEAVDSLLHAAMAAPTAGNKQPWRIVVVNEREKLDYIAAEFGSMKMAAEAQVAIVLCGDTTATFEGEGRDYWVQDVSAATENLLLAAHSMGLGAVWCGIFPISERVGKFSTLLSLPQEIVPMACVCVGYPAAESTPKDKWIPENVRYNNWSTK